MSSNNSKWRKDNWRDYSEYLLYRISIWINICLVEWVLEWPWDGPAGFGWVYHGTDVLGVGVVDDLNIFITKNTNRNVARARKISFIRRSRHRMTRRSRVLMRSSRIVMKMVSRFLGLILFRKTFTWRTNPDQVIFMKYGINCNTKLCSYNHLNIDDHCRSNQCLDFSRSYCSFPQIRACGSVPTSY